MAYRIIAGRGAKVLADGITCTGIHMLTDWISVINERLYERLSENLLFQETNECKYKQTYQRPEGATEMTMNEHTH